MLAMLSGDPGSGTTHLALAIAATVARKARVLYLSAENSRERVVRTRFDVLGGNPQRFHLLRGPYYVIRVIAHAIDGHTGMASASTCAAWPAQASGSAHHAAAIRPSAVALSTRAVSH
jgi:predicted ATP-dependent serine protease